MFDVHEDNLATLQVFLALRTQWRVLLGFGAAATVGLEYTAIPVVMAFLGVAPEDRAVMFDDLRAMEAAALPILNPKKGDRDGE